MKELYNNRDELAGNKFSGVHFVNGAYRVHKNAFIPQFVSWSDTSTDKKIALVVKEFGENMEWDNYSLWLTMYD